MNCITINADMLQYKWTALMHAVHGGELEYARKLMYASEIELDLQNEVTDDFHSYTQQDFKVYISFQFCFVSFINRALSWLDLTSTSIY